MSYDGDTHTVLKGVTHGAVDFLIKPVRMEELSNMWQHVVRKRALRPSEERGQDGMLVPGPGSKRAGSISSDGGPMPADAAPPDTTAAPGPAPHTHESKKRTPEDRDASAGPPPGSKRPRVHWSSHMHSQFVAAVNKLGIDKAVPKKILELMTVEGLTRENVASHLQKYRLYLKKAAKMDSGAPAASPAAPDAAAPAAVQPAPGTPPPEPPFQGYQGTGPL